MRNIVRTSLGFLGGLLALVAILLFTLSFGTNIQQNQITYWVFGGIASIIAIASFYYGYKGR